MVVTAKVVAVHSDCVAVGFFDGQQQVSLDVAETEIGSERLISMVRDVVENWWKVNKRLALEFVDLTTFEVSAILVWVNWRFHCAAS